MSIDYTRYASNVWYRHIERFAAEWLTPSPKGHGVHASCTPLTTSFAGDTGSSTAR